MDVIVPKVGLTVEVVEILEWHVAPGDAVVAGDPLVDLAADKADIAVEAPADGVLLEILAESGAEVGPGDAIGRIGDAGEVGSEVPASAPEAAPKAPAESPARDAPASPVARRAADALGVEVSAVEGSGPRGRVLKRDVERAATPVSDGEFAGGARPSSPAARRLAAELRVTLERVDGTGPGGRIVEADIRRAQTSGEPPPAGISQQSPIQSADLGPMTPARWTAARRLTSRRMAEATETVAPVTLHRRADAGSALAGAKALKDSGVRATFTHVLLACVAAGLAEHPAANSVWENGKLMRCESVHLGLAVDVDDGLFVPVIRDAARLDVGELATIASGLVAQCRTGTIAPESLRGSTFSVSNLGMLGVEQFTPIVNPPHVAILGVGSIVEEAVPSPAGIGFRKSCHLSLTFDHRALDGAPAARFLDAIVAHLEGFSG